MGFFTYTQDDDLLSDLLTTLRSEALAEELNEEHELEHRVVELLEHGRVSERGGKNGRLRR
jgi:hypothetical protein